MNQSDYVSATEAARFLDVKLPTLYAYVSRGLLRSRPGNGPRARDYAVADLVRLKSRHDARSGHGPVAAAALDWGEPVLESAITDIGPDGPSYRGQTAVALARAHVGFDRVAELLWTGVLPEAAEPTALVSFRAPAVPSGIPRLSALALAIAHMALGDPHRFGAGDDDELPRARAIVRRLAAALALGLDSTRLRPALAAGSVAEAAATALGLRGRGARLAALEQALVLSADHELNASTFAARIAASAGADLYACVAAGLAVVSGPRHGGACDRIEALVEETRSPDRARLVLAERGRRGEAIPGFGHPLYPHGDPRALPLLEAARALAPKRRSVQTLLALIRAMRAAHREPPAADAGLVALTLALGLPPGSAGGIFAVGRAAGWIAHALEQRRSSVLLRPRAQYVGVTR